MNDARSGNFMDVMVSYDTDMDKAKEVMIHCIESPAETINIEDERTDHYTYVFTREFAGSGIWLRTNVWTKTVDTNFRVCSEIRDSIIKGFHKNGIEIPYNKRDVYMKETENKTNKS